MIPAIIRINFAVLSVLAMAAGIARAELVAVPISQRVEGNADMTAPPTRVSRWIFMEVTAYCPCEKCCGADAQGITASGKPVTTNGGRFVAADTRVLPFGSRLHISGYGDSAPVPVLDRGGAIKGNRLDVFFPAHRQAMQWGRRWMWVEVE